MILEPQLKAFAIVARFRDVALAAFSMALTPTEVLTLIGELEMAVRGPLFVRRDDEPIPSPLAEQMSPRVERIADGEVQSPIRWH